MTNDAQLATSVLEVLLASAEPTALQVAGSTRTAARTGGMGAVWEEATARAQVAKAKGKQSTSLEIPTVPAPAITHRGAGRARRLVDVFADEVVSSRIATSATLGSAATASATPTTTFGPISVQLPIPNAASIAGMSIGALFILTGVLYLCCRHRRDFRGNRIERDSESGPGALEVGLGGAAVVVEKEAVKAKAKVKRGGTADENKWRREIRLELEAEVVDLKRKEKEDMLKHKDMCSM